MKNLSLQLVAVFLMSGVAQAAPMNVCKVDKDVLLQSPTLNQENCSAECLKKSPLGKTCTFVQNTDGGSTTTTTKKIGSTSCTVTKGTLSLTYSGKPVIDGTNTDSEKAICAKALNDALMASKDPATDGAFEVSFKGAPDAAEVKTTLYKATIQAKRTGTEATGETEVRVQTAADYKTACTAGKYGDYAEVKVGSINGITGCEKLASSVKALCNITDGTNSIKAQELNNKTILANSEACYSYCQDYIEKNKKQFFGALSEVSSCKSSKAVEFKCNYKNPSETGAKTLILKNACYQWS